MNLDLLIFFGAVLILGIIVFAWVVRRSGHTRLNVEKYRSDWLSIERQLVKDSHASYVIAVLNADKLLDKALKESGYRGNTMGERMKSAKNTWKNANQVWTAHKVRNTLAHETDAAISYDTARRALAAFKQALKDVGAI